MDVHRERVARTNVSTTVKASHEVWSDPPLSVVLCVYNQAPYISEAVESILNQSFEQFEFVIVNDGSTDGTAEKIRAYSDPRIRVLDVSRVGVAEGRNLGLRSAKGTYVAMLDGDDVSIKTRLQVQLAYLDKHPAVDIVSSDYTAINARGVQLRTFHAPCSHSALYRLLRGGDNPLPHSSVMFRRDVVATCGGYRKEFEPAEDYDLWLRASSVARFANIPEALVKVRVLPRSFSGTGDDARQLRSCLFSRWLHALGESGIQVTPSSRLWCDLRALFDDWFVTQSYDSHVRSVHACKTALLEWGDRRVIKCCISLLTALRHDPSQLARLWGRGRESLWGASQEGQLRRLHGGLQGLS